MKTGDLVLVKNDETETPAVRVFLFAAEGLYYATSKIYYNSKNSKLPILAFPYKYAKPISSDKISNELDELKQKIAEIENRLDKIYGEW